MPKHIMVINDTQEILQLFYDLLTPEGYEVSLHTYSIRDLEEVRRIMPDLIISDHPPFREEQGWQMIQKVKMSPDTAHIPVVLCTTSLKWLRANVDEGLLTLKGISVLGKPFNVGELLQQVCAMISEAHDQEIGAAMRGVENHNGPESSLSG